MLQRPKVHDKIKTGSVKTWNIKDDMDTLTDFLERIKSKNNMRK